MDPFDRDTLIEMGGGLTVAFGGQIFHDLRSYYEAVEVALGSLERDLRKGFEQRRSEFSPEIQQYIERYKWNPRWDATFPHQLRVSVIVSISSAVEAYLKHLCDDVKEIVRAPISSEDIRGGSTKRAQTFLRAFGGLERPTDSTWNQLHQAAELRNLLVHSGGVLEAVRDLGRVRKLSQAMPGISIDEELGIAIERELCLHYLDLAEHLHDETRGEIQALCSRLKFFEEKNRKDVGKS